MDNGARAMIGWVILSEPEGAKALRIALVDFHLEAYQTEGDEELWPSTDSIKRIMSANLPVQ